MKTINKIALIAAITALAALSCEPAITKPHNEWLDDYNEQFDNVKYLRSTYSGTFSFVASSISSTGEVVENALSIGDKAINRVTVTISDATADVYKADNPEAKLKEFLVFYTFNPTELTLDDIDAGKTHTLNALTGWSLERRSGATSFIIKLPSSFTAASSNVVWKIAGDKFTYRDGVKIDKNGNGVPGEAVFDDYYGNLTVKGITHSSTNASIPQNSNFNVTLTLTYTIPGTPGSTTLGSDSGFPVFPAEAWASPTATDTSGAPGTAVITVATTNSFTASFMTAEDKDDLLRSLVSGIKLEKYTETEGKWTSTGLSAVFDETYTPHRIVFKDFRAVHMTAYRIVVEKSSLSLETAKEYYSVKQRFRVTYNGVTISEDKTSQTKIEGPGRLYFNPAIRNFVTLADANYMDYTGTITTKENVFTEKMYTHSYTYNYVWTFTYTYKQDYSWSPGFVKKQITVTSEPNDSGPNAYVFADHVLAAAADVDITDDDSGYLTYLNTHPKTNNISPTNVDIDSARYYNWTYYDGVDSSTPVKVYTGFIAAGTASPNTDPKSSNVTLPTTTATATKTAVYEFDDPSSSVLTVKPTPPADLTPSAPSAPAAPSAPSYTPNSSTVDGGTAGNYAWEWSALNTPTVIPGTTVSTYTSVMANPVYVSTPDNVTFKEDIDTNTTIKSEDVQYRTNRFVMETPSVDGNGNNVVLKLVFGPISVKKDGVTTRNYAKQLDLAAFKENFKIRYSRGGNSAAYNAADAMEIGIEKVEFVQEKTALDSFENTTTVKYNGYNVIYITLDPNYKTNSITKYFLIGSGFGYTDGVSVFSSQDIWENNGFGIYSIGAPF